MPEGFVESARIESKALVEEYMLLANILVAEFIKPYCREKTLLRSHMDINSDKKEQLNNFFKLVGLGDQIDLTDSTTLSRSMETLKSQKDQKMFNVARRKFFSHLQAAKYVTIGSAEE